MLHYAAAAQPFPLVHCSEAPQQMYDLQKPSTPSLTQQHVLGASHALTSVRLGFGAAPFTPAVPSLTAPRLWSEPAAAPHRCGGV